MSPYAAGTDVSSSKSRDEIERTLRRFGADQFAYGWSGNRAVIGFVMRDRQVRFLLPLPDPGERRFTHTPTGRPRTKTSAADEHAQAVRARWRSLALIVKAKLVAVEDGVVTFEQEFAAHMVLPDGSLVADRLTPAIEQAYATGAVPPLLAIGGTE